MPTYTCILEIVIDICLNFKNMFAVIYICHYCEAFNDRRTCMLILFTNVVCRLFFLGIIKYALRQAYSLHVTLRVTILLVGIIFTRVNSGKRLFQLFCCWLIGLKYVTHASLACFYHYTISNFFPKNCWELESMVRVKLGLNQHC